MSGGARVIVSTSLTFLLTLEFLRAWAVTMPLLYQGFTTMSPVSRGLAVFSPFIVGFAAAIAFTRIRPPRWALVVVIAGSRVALQAIGGGFWGLAVSLLGLAACVSLLVGFASRRQTVLGLVAALAVDAILLMALKTESLVFRNSTTALIGSVLMVAVFIAAQLRAEDTKAGSSGRRAAVSSRTSVVAWLAFGVALVLHLTVASLPAPLETATGWSAEAARTALAASYAAGAILALWAGERKRGRLRRIAPRFIAFVATLLALPGMIDSSPRWQIVASLTLPIAIMVGMASVSLPGRPVRSLLLRLAAAGAFTMGVAIPFAYYLGFVYRYAIDPKWLLVAVALLFALITGSSAAAELAVRERLVLVSAEPSTAAPVVSARWRGIRAALTIVVATALLVVLPGVGLGRLGPPAAEQFPVRVMSYNIFMGLGADVNLDLDRLASQIAAQKPDVVALQEVSRGWFTSGSVDLLSRLAERLGYSYHFFPAADDTWGNAILTNLPSEEYTIGILPRGSSAMQRGWGGALLKLGDGQRLLVVVSHLHHPHDGQLLRGEQAEALVEGTISLADKYDLLPLTVLVGDMNAESDSVELSPVRSFFWDALSEDPLPTYPSWAPKQRIDHIFVSDGLEASDPAVFGGLASDHLGIAVSLRPVEAQGSSSEASTDEATVATHEGPADDAPTPPWLDGAPWSQLPSSR